MKSLIKYLVGLVAIALVLGVPYIINREHCPTVDAWVGFLGNYIGALLGAVLGALIAYGVAKYQVNQMRKQEMDKRYLNQSVTVVSVMLQLEKIINSYTEIQALIQSNGLILFEESCDAYRDLAVYIVSIDKDSWGNIGILINMDLQKKIIIVKEQYINDYNALICDITQLEQKLRNFNNERAKKILCDKSENNSMGIDAALNKGLTKAKKNRIEALKKVDENLKKALDLQEEISSLKSKLEKKNEKHYKVC